MIKHATARKTGTRTVPLTAGRLRSPVVIVILAVLAALAVLLRHYK
jgi:hypothetical protein